MSEQLHFWPEEAALNRLSWSVTRDKRLRDCRRKYYLQHYGSRGGFKTTAPAAVREAYILKHLRNRHMWVGETVHEMIEMAFTAWRRGDPAPLEALVERGTRRMRAQFAESVQGIYRERPRHACGLLEHEYREPVTREQWKAQRDRMERCLNTFFELPMTAQIRETPAWRWLALESLASFELCNATVWVKPDFAWRATDDSVVVVDWKTGKPRIDDEWLQMAVYGVYARRAWGIGGAALRGQLVYLETGAIHTVELSGADLDKAEEAICDSVSQMRSLTTAAEKGPEGLTEFPLTDELARCRWCCFKRLCNRASAGLADEKSA